MNDACHQMADKWSSIIGNSNAGDSAVIDVSMWMGRATLDACVLALVSGAHRLRTNRDLIFRKDRHWGFRLRLWRLGRYR